jgi:hypothetical protein
MYIILVSFPQFSLCQEGTLSTNKITAKLKNLRRSIKLWAKNFPYLQMLIEKVNSVIPIWIIWRKSELFRWRNERGKIKKLEILLEAKRENKKMGKTWRCI